MKRLYFPLLRSTAIVAVLWLSFEFVARQFAEILWFKEVNYLEVFLVRRLSQYGLWLGVALLTGLYLGGNLRLASRWGWRWLPKSNWFNPGDPISPQQPLLSPQKTSHFGGTKLAIKAKPSPKTYFSRLDLPWFLLGAIACATLITYNLLSYTKIALSVWRTSYRLPQLVATLHPSLNMLDLEGSWGLFLSYLRQFGIVGIIVVLLLWRPQTSLRAIAILTSLVMGLIAAGNWTTVLRFLQPTAFDLAEPQFGHDLGFYIFRFPFWHLVESWLIGLTCVTLLCCLLSYLLSGNSLSEGSFPGFTQHQLRHLSWLGAAVMFSLAMHHWLNRFDLLYNTQGVVYGASYTNIKVQLPWENALTAVASIAGMWWLFRGVRGYRSLSIRQQRRQQIIWLALPIIIYVMLLPLSNFANATVQKLEVQPNELAKERPYIQRSIAMTRRAFNLDQIEAKTFNPQGQLIASMLEKNASTIKNIRLWDTRPILQTNRQLQQIRPYYQFHDADIDRYLLGSEPQPDKQQVIITARELDYSQVQDIAKTWINEHLIYTHGYGFTLSPVNRVAEGGLPYYYIKDIGTDSKESGALTVTDDLIDENIPLGKPRIYFGELTDPYIMTSTTVKELDYPSGEENVYTVYDGAGGIKIGNYGRRLLFAEYLKDWQMLFAQNFTPETKLLFRRNIKQRVQAIAPFLKYDGDPYLVAADVADAPQGNKLFWIIDAYTISDSYPYSDPGGNKFNYLRNSVKVVVDAYNGQVDFYMADATEPILQTWHKIFPRLFRPLSAMPPALRQHIRYPEDLFQIQSETLLTYHMQDPQVFYNREDQWQIPQEIYGNEAQPVAPYYLIMKLPTATQAEFILLHPYTPTSRPNLIAWLAARSDGDAYGKLLLYKFPKQKLIYGPNQIEALINQDPVISQQISLWNREGSRAIQGNLLIIPIEQSLLYVEPLYIEAEENSLPALARVIVIYENQIVMAETLEEGIKAIFKPQPDSAAIIRPVEDVTAEP